MVILPKDSTQSQSKFQHNSLQTLKGPFSTSHGGGGGMTAKTILNNERTARSPTIPDLKLYYRAIITKIP